MNIWQKTEGFGAGRSFTGIGYRGALWKTRPELKQPHPAFSWLLDQLWHKAVCACLEELRNAIELIDRIKT
jgi:hypothetical protein